MRGPPRIQEGSRSPWAGVVALGLAAGLGFLVPAVTVDLLAWSRPRLVGVLAVVVFSLVRGYARSTGEAILPAGRRHWMAGVAVGALAGGVVVAHVLAQPSSPAPRGIGLVLAVVWLGVV
jgi:hypothetical protein